MKSLLSAVFVGMSLLVAAMAAPPAWWTERGVTTGAPTSDYAVANLGQVKHIATQAAAEMNAHLSGGAGTAINDLIATWQSPSPAVVDYATVNQGQLKSLVKFFYDRLAEESFEGSPLPPGQIYPWTDDTEDDSSFAVANIGQVKYLFSFSLVPVIPPIVDTDGDGMTDSWEQSHGLNPNSSADVLLDLDNDGLTNIAEYNLGKNPQGYDQGTSALGNAMPAGWPNTGINASLAVGTTMGELNVDKSGAATYSVPIWTTPGTAGMAPQVSLNYSSQAGMGPAGFGWSISGASVITRGPAMLAVDGYIDGVDFDANDQFYLDGQRLILISAAGTHGQPGAEYRTELDTFTKVVAYGIRGNGPARFKAQTKAGLTIWFGNATNDSTDDASTFNAFGHNEPFSWHVSRITDTKGNYMTFTYEEVVSAAEGSHRLQRIDYTGNGTGSGSILPYASVRFEYENRPDAIRGYASGSPVSNLKRLKYIRSYYGETVARTYALTYIERQFTQRSLLTNLAETGSDGKAYPPLTFDYGTPSYGWEQPASGFTFEPGYQLADNRGNGGKGFPAGTGFMDLNGDGRVDFIVKRDGTGGDDRASLNSGTGWTDNPSFRLPYPLAVTNDSKETGARFVDFDSDGLVDYVVYKVDAGGNPVVCHSWRNTGSGWDPVDGAWLLPAPSARYHDDYTLRGGRFTDVNGDGRTDYIAFLTTTPGTNGGKAKLAVFLNTGSGWETTPNTGYAVLPGGSPPDLADKQARFIDINGDGLPDIVSSYKNGSAAPEAYVCLNTGTGWEGTDSRWVLPTWIAENNQPRIGAEFVDMNGDGLPDLIWSREQPAPAQWGYALNTGNGWDTHLMATGDLFTSPAELGRKDYSSGGATFTDFNADGLPDILMSKYYSGPGLFKSVHLGSGAGWHATSDTTWQLPAELLREGVTNMGVDFADFNGDGVTDFVCKRWNSDGSVTKGLWRSKANPLADRLSRVTNGLGVDASITYQTLLNASVYTKGSNGPVGSVDLSGPLYVVSSVAHDDGMAGNHVFNYQYTGLRSDRLRGSLGFAQMVVTDTRTSIRSETTFRQDFPFIGMPRAAKTISGSVTLKDSSITYAEKLLNTNKTHFVFVQVSTEISKDLDGSLLGTTTTTIPTPNNYIDSFGNIIRIIVDTDGFVKTTVSEYTNDTTNWYLGRLTSSMVTSDAPTGYGSDITRASSFTYDSGTGLLLSEVVQPGDTVFGLTTTYGYDQFGNKTSVQVSGPNLTVDSGGNYASSGTASRTTTTQYDDKGRFPSWTKNALNHQETYNSYNPVLGVLTQMTGANGLVTTWGYDGFGRKIQENRADGTMTKTTYRWVSDTPAQARFFSSSHAGAKYHIETESTGAPASLAFYDALGHGFLTLGVNGDGKIVYQTTQYDNRSRAFATSTPYFASGTAYWTRTLAGDYDLLDRPKKVITPDDPNITQTTTYAYNGLTITVTDPKGRQNRVVRNAVGWILTSTRNLNGLGGASASTVAYEYDAIGNLVKTTADGVITTLGYDPRGRKRTMTDSDMGTWLYRYNAFGELIWQKDAKDQSVTMSYDALGRMTSRVEAEGTTSWTYDTSPTKGTGKLHTVFSPGGYSETYLYDGLGRPSSISRIIDGVTYATQTTYDSVGRPLRTIYPASVAGAISTRNVYNAFGYLKEIRNHLDADNGRPNNQLQGRVYWMADSYAVTGQISGETYGNGLGSDRYFSEATGRLQYASIDRGDILVAPFFVQDLSYTYDPMGNVNSRTESATGFARDERFYTSAAGDGYDGLDRLKVHRVVGGATVTVGYDQKGNITSKSDVGAYTYAGFGQHALNSAGANSYTYDANGNMLAGAGRTLEWASFNQLRKVTQGSLSSQFSFGAGHERIKQERKNGTTVTDTTIYVGGLYEKVVTAATGVVEYKHYIMGPTGRIAVYTERSDFSKDTRWFHTDGLGSITVVSDEKGKVLKRYAYDAWGKQGTVYTNTGGGITNTAPSTRGFTDHEMLNDYGLIHMNGRIYDPVLGRFLSADPFVGDEYDSQDYNRYSYVGNNPMNATDPSGYFSLKDAVKIVAIVVVAYFTAGAALYLSGGITGVAAGATATFGNALSALAGVGGFGTTLGGAIAAGAGAGFASGFAGSLLNGGSIGYAFKAGIIGGAIGAVAGGLTYGIGGSNMNYFERAAAHGVVGGASESAGGGQFRHGFYAGFATAAASPGIGLVPKQVRFIAAAVVGGTASAIGGGKFANGAITGAFQYLLNDAQHETAEGKTLPATDNEPGYSTAYVGGAKDGTTGIVRDSVVLKPGDAYFEWNQGDKLVDWIKSTEAGRKTRVVGHSWGADTAATIVAKGNRVDMLVTVDPVGWTRPNMKSVAKYAGSWRNYDSVGGGLTFNNMVAFSGRAWNSAPRGSANYHTTVKLDHVEIWNWWNANRN